VETPPALPTPPAAQAPVPQAPQTTPAQTPPAPAAPAGGFIGVMLPLTGQYAVAAQAMRTGLTAAAGADANPSKPELRFVDTQSGDIGGIYRKLADEGAKFVIGPLTKEEVAALGKLGELPVPALALNQSPEVVPREGLYQFALTPEQEVEQAASLAWFDGRQNALLLAPASAFGQRMINHFSTYWKSLGGRIANIKTYQPGAPDYSDTARQLLASVAGGDASSRPEFIFLIADSRDGRLLNPHIQNQQASRIPVYATSQIFNGQPGAPQNQDLSGVTFCDSPWLLGNDNGPLSRTALQVTAQQTPELYLRLLPMGIDAYRLVTELGQLKAGGQNRYNGASGVLTLKSDNRVQRQLHCAQFEGAALQQRGIAPTLQPGAAAPGSP
jgi:outer membrane PBP1 activator LpoA protein